MNVFIAIMLVLIFLGVLLTGYFSLKCFSVLVQITEFINDMVLKFNKRQIEMSRFPEIEDRNIQ